MYVEPPENPLLSNSPSDWTALIESVGPASLLVVINQRMKRQLRQRIEAEDVLQEALLTAWRDRGQFEWRGIKSFRSWLLAIIDHRICDLVRHYEAGMRNPTRPILSLSAPAVDPATWGVPIEIAASTTPSRLGAHRERAEQMQSALESLPDTFRDVIFLRHFEQRTFSDVAGQLGIGEDAARSRYRKGSEMYRLRLKTLISSRWTAPQKNRPEGAPDSAPDDRKG